MTDLRIADLPRLRHAGVRVGITSVCTAHPLVIEAALRQAAADGMPALIEATCNQVNQHGGYTGMTPAAFRTFVLDIARRVGFDPARLILGGDHLGPNPWKHLPAEEAMREAETMIAAYARAGFSKLHLDTSMGCRGEPAALPDEVTAARAARLAAAAEKAGSAGEGRPSYVIGTEVPVPGGATEALDHLAVTRPEAVARTVEVHRDAFNKAGLDAAFSRAVAVVVQPGVEFGHAEVVPYDPARAASLVEALGDLPPFVFEAHSTDYQTVAALTALVDDGFAILKVGPGLTFALREALYGLDHVADVLAPVPGRTTLLRDALEGLMQAEPSHWERYHEGDAAALFAQRHFSYSDRIRYYWPHPLARAAVAALVERLGEGAIPQTLVSQYLPRLAEAVRAGAIEARPRDLLVAATRTALDAYSAACATI